ncbi:helix-turn-helix transcriptional regulator [Longispora sp. NPDC051575]|uniref:helix-turn-helix transcriptional regulator n=1 Tax=Longispora sp. NPDC051575 TaxID=3154943 RepID=UPI003414889E
MSGTIRPIRPAPAGGPRTPGQVLRQARADRCWSQSRLIAEMARLAREHGHGVPTRASMRTMISLWENDHRNPDDYNQVWVCRALRIPVESLGLPPILYPHRHWDAA